MARKIKSLYEHFLDYSEDSINQVLYSLSDEERLLLLDRYGYDLKNPKITDHWNSLKSKQFYDCLLPKIKRMLIKNAELEKQKEISKKSSSRFLTNQALELLKLLEEKKSNQELCKILGISSKQLYERLLNLKNKGISYSKTYYSDGTIKYKTLGNSFEGFWKTKKSVERYNLEKLKDSRTIITDPKETDVKVLAMSDLHFGNALERIDLVDRMYNYCIKHNIHLIVGGGDLIDGNFGKGTQKITDLYEQSEYFIKNYPKADQILTFSVAGDHDFSALKESSLNLAELCDHYRHDLIIGNFNNFSLNLKNDSIHLFHHINYCSLLQKSPIIFHGHSHKFVTQIKDNTLHVTIPSLSNINQPMPTVLEVNLSFEKGYIAHATIKQIYFGKEDYILGEFDCDVRKKIKETKEAIRNEEIFQETFSKEKKKVYHK